MVCSHKCNLLHRESGTLTSDSMDGFSECYNTLINTNLLLRIRYSVILPVFVSNEIVIFSPFCLRSIDCLQPVFLHANFSQSNNPSCRMLTGTK